MLAAKKDENGVVTEKQTYNSKLLFGDYTHKYYYNCSIADGYTLRLIREESEIPRLMVLRTGAQQPHINKGVLDDSPLVLPDDGTLAAYSRLTSALYSQIQNHHWQNQALTALRDWLLPMLMNGQVRVA